MSQLKSMAIGAAVAGVAFAIYRYTCKAKAPKSLTLTYFDIAAAPGEKVRLALKLAGVPFTDNRIKFPDWGALKPKTKYGQMPFVEVRPTEGFLSSGFLTLCCRLLTKSALRRPTARSSTSRARCSAGLASWEAAASIRSTIRWRAARSRR